VAKAYREKPSGANEDDIIQNDHDIYEIKMGKKFNLMHWWYLEINLNGRVHVINLWKLLPND